MIWTAKLHLKQPWPSSIDGDLATFESFLTEEELGYLCVQKNPKRYYEFAFGRTLTKLLTSEISGVEINKIKLSLPNNDAPILSVGNTTWHLSIAHSTGVVYVAVSQNNKVGIDVQWSRRSRNLQALISEFPALTGVTANEFYERWTCLEAYAKLSNQAVSELLQQPFFPSGVIFETYESQGFFYALASTERTPIQTIDGSNYFPQSFVNLLNITG